MNYGLEKDMDLNYKLKRNLMICTFRYSCDMVAEVINVPVLWVRSAYLDSKALSNKQKNKMLKYALKSKEFRKMYGQLKKRENINELKQFYHDDAVMCALDTKGEYHAS